ncbi:ankyrin repeat-containing protein [Anaeramoeba flamelloides]|uniref:Ankyrin repeat-containing protein n=1 Tax=Anaeramoeba flamelloides TaxID=1746091 RepID=A0ABQ8XU33_9EUKA|nr:ankyrin repeat-containing protein [Anaeramoeba flamelloides]
MTEQILNNYPNLYLEYHEDEEKLDQLFNKVKIEENSYRELFVKDRKAKILDDDHLMLMDIYKNYDLFKKLPLTEKEKAIPTLFKSLSSEKTDQEKNEEKEIEKEEKNEENEKGIEIEKEDEDEDKEEDEFRIEDEQQFKTNFKIFTERQFDFFNWKNVLVAGGSVLASLMKVPKKYSEDISTRREYFNEVSYTQSDIDLFLYGLTEEEANEKVKEIYKSIKQTLPFKCICFRSRNSISIVSQYPFRSIQIILRLYKSPAEVLMGFDIDSSSVGYDGERVWVTPRAHRAIIKMQNGIDMSRRSPTYEKRLAKYAARGFSVVVPFLDENKIDPQIYERRVDRVHGLAKLLLYEKLKSAKIHKLYQEFVRMQKLRTSILTRGNFWRRVLPQANVQYFESSPHESDYSSVFLPWGKEWTAEKVQKVMYKKDFILNSKWYDPDKTVHTHPCFFGTAEQVLGDCCGDPNCSKTKIDELFEEGLYVNGKVQWKTVDPGQQRIGSFHPITDQDWTKEAYISKESEHMCKLIVSRDANGLRELIMSNKENKEGEQLDVNKKDYLGRPPLHLAVMNKSRECIKILLEHGAKISYRLIDGRSALHLACQYGDYEIVEIIVNRLNEIKLEKEKQKQEQEQEQEQEKKVVSKQKFSLKRLLELKNEKLNRDQIGYQPSTTVHDQEFDIDSPCWDHGMSCLHYAIFFNHQTIIKLLIDKCKADINKPIQFIGANKTVKLYVNSLLIPIITNDFTMLKKLLEYGINPYQLDYRDNSVIHNGIKYARYEIVKQYIQLLKERKLLTNFPWYNSNRENPINTLLSKIHLIINEEEIQNQQILKTEEELELENDLQNPKNKYYKEYQMLKYLLEKTPLNGQITESELPQKFDHLFKNQRKQFCTYINQPLYLAVRTESHQIISLLLKHGADANWVYLTPCATILDRIENNLVDLQKQIGHKQMVSYNNSEVIKIEEINNEMKFYPKDSFIRNELKGQIRQLENLVKNRMRFLGEYKQLSQNVKQRDLIVKKYKNEKKKKKKKKEKSGNEMEIEEEGEEKEKEKEKEEEEEEWDDDEELNELDKEILEKERNLALLYQLNIKERLLNTNKNQLLYLNKRYQNNLIIKQVLSKHKAKTFVKLQLNNTPNDFLIELQNRVKQSGIDGLQNWKMNFSNYYIDARDQTNEKIKHQVRYRYVTETFPGSKYFNGTINREEQDLYKELFEAVYQGDIKEVERLTLHDKKLFISCSTSHSNRTPLHVAIQQGNFEMVQKIIEILVKQHVSIYSVIQRGEEKKKKNYVPKINNLDLLIDIKPKDHLSHSEEAQLENFNQIDIGDILKVQRQSIVSPMNFLLHRCISGFTCIEFAIAANNTKILRFLFDTLKQWDLNGKGKYMYPFSPLNKKDESLLEYVFFNHANLSTFQFSLAMGSVEMSKILLDYGGFKLQPKKIVSNYTGLNVEGEKNLKWLKENTSHVSNQNTKPMSLYCTALHNKASSFNWLTKEAEGQFFKKYADVDLTEYHTPKDFDQYYCEKKFNRSVLHYAMKRNSPEFVQNILDKDKKKFFLNHQDTNGVTPLILATHFMAQENMKILLEMGCDLSLTTKENGWSVLHYAVKNNDPYSLKLLLKYADEGAVNLPSRFNLQTPLMLAAYWKYNKCLYYLIKYGHANKFALDLFNFSALSYAVLGSNFNAVKLLLPQSLKNSSFFFKEDAFGNTILDLAKNKCIQKIENDPLSDYFREIDFKNVKDSIEIWKYLCKFLSDNRTLIPFKNTKQITNIIPYIEISDKYNSFPQQFLYSYKYFQGRWEQLFSYYLW